VLDDRTFGDHQLLGDRRVRAALRHQAEDLPLARREAGERAVAVVLLGEQLGDDVGVHRGAAGRDAAHRVHEAVRVEHPVLEEVADASAAVGEEFAGVELFHVLGEDEDRQAGDVAACLQGGPQALVRERRRKPDVDDRDVRLVVEEGPEQSGPGVHGGDHLEVVGLQKTDESVPQQEEVLG